MSSDTSRHEFATRSNSPFVRIVRERTPSIRLRPGIIWTLIWIAMGCAVAYFLAPQLSELRASLRSLRSVQPSWVIVGIGLMVLRYAMAALTVQSAAGPPVAFVPTVLVQLSSSFVGRLTPEGVGWLVLNQRYLEKAGLARSTALAAITLKVLAGGIVRLLVMALVATLAGTSGIFQFDVPFSWTYLVTAALAVGLLVLILRLAFVARTARVMASVRSGFKDLGGVFRQPARAATLFGASVLVTLSYPLVLIVSLLALGVEFSFLDVFVVYLGGTAVASTSPTPGNLGAVEVALSTGLVAVGVATAPAAAAVLIYRLLTFWLPVLPGFIAFRYVQKQGHL